jgi:protein SCO1
MPTRRVLVAAATAALLATQARAAEKPCEHCHPKPGAADAAAAPADPAAAATPAPDARVELADVTLLDQRGARVPLRALMTGDQVVVVDFVFTTCTTVCPVLSALMARLQDRLGDRVGKDVLLVSMSIDPVRDTPGRLEAHALRYRAKPGWIWLTGQKEDVDRALKGMGAYSPSIGEHAPMFLVGDGKAGAWTRFNGFPNLDRVLARVDALASSRTSLAQATPEKE